MKSREEARQILAACIAEAAQQLNVIHDGTHLIAVAAAVSGHGEVAKAMTELCDAFHQLDDKLHDAFESLKPEYGNQFGEQPAADMMTADEFFRALEMPEGESH